MTPLQGAEAKAKEPEIKYKDGAKDTKKQRGFSKRMQIQIHSIY